MRQYLEAGHPVCLCTDDSGVFQTTLTDEYLHAAKTFSVQGVLSLALGLEAGTVMPMIGSAGVSLFSTSPDCSEEFVSNR
jgi:hypothetical protein